MLTRCLRYPNVDSECDSLFAGPEPRNVTSLSPEFRLYPQVEVAKRLDEVAEYTIRARQ